MHCSLGIIFCRLSLVVGLLQAAVFLPVSVMVLKRFLGIGDPGTALTWICFILGGFSALYMASTSIGRVCIATAVQSPRYLPLMTPAYIALFLFLRTGSPNKLKRYLLITLFFGLSLKALVCSFPFAEISMAPMVEISNKKKLWIESYLETEDLRLASNMSGFKLYPADPMVLSDRMKYLRRRNLTFFQTK